MNVKTIRLPKAEEALIGMTIPEMEETYRNNVANAIEDAINDTGYNVDKLGTIDLPDHKVEVKSRSTNATSPQTIGSMSVNNIINTPYNSSSIKEKFQQQLRVKHNQTYCVVTKAKVYDFSDPVIQQKIEQAYEYGRSVMTNTSLDDLPDYISPNGHIGYFERTNKKHKTVYSFRLSNSTMKKLESIASSSKVFRQFFEF